MRVVALLLGLTLAAGAAAQSDGLSVTWRPAPPWLAPVDANRPYYRGAVDYGTGFVFGSVPGREIPPVWIVFADTVETRARVFDDRRGLEDRGEGTFLGAAYDMTDPDQPRRLNVGFLENDARATPDRRWNPDGSPTGAREYLFVFDSDYVPGAPQYQDETLYGLDVLYGLALRQADGRTLYEAALDVRLVPPPLRDVSATALDNGVAEVVWTAASYVQAQRVEVRDGATLLGAAAPEVGRVVLDGLDPDRRLSLTVDLVGDAVLASLPATVRPRVSLGVAAASSLDPGRAGGSTYADVWGYTAPDGTEYALLAVRAGGLSVLDVSAAPAAPPVEVAFVATAAADAKDVKVYGHHAYVVHETAPVAIVDLSAPRQPVVVGTLDVQPGVAQGGGHNVVIARDHLWVVGGRTQANAGVRVYSLADPTAPSLVGTFRPDHLAVPYYHDFEVRGGIGYGAAIYGGGVDVLDVSDPSAITRLAGASLDYPGAGAHNTCTTEDGRTVYVGDEIGTSGHWMRIFDVSDVQDPELVGEIIVDRAATVHNCYVRGARLYVAHYTEGLRVFDITAPHAPVEVALLDTYRQPGLGTRGAWTAYPYLDSGKVLVSDMQTGLWVVTLTQPTPTEPPPMGAAAVLAVSPNPTTGGVRMAYTLAEDAQVRIALVDLLGREVAVVHDQAERAGPHRPIVDVRGLPSGRYLAVLTADGEPLATAAVTVVR